VTEDDQDEAARSFCPATSGWGRIRLPHVEVLGLAVVRNKGRGGLLRFELELLCDRVNMSAYGFAIGDYDCDFDVDLGDFSSCFSRITGPEGGPYAEGCEACDFDYDLDVDLFDFAGFQAAFTLE
jgi:hypothetical protein